MKKTLSAALIICVFAACDSKPKIKIVDLEESTSPPASATIEESLLDSSSSSTANFSEARTVQTSISRLTEDGEFYLLERVSKVTDVGIVAFAAGKKVKLVKTEGEMMTVTDGQEEVKVEVAKLTRNIEQGEALHARVSAERKATNSAIEGNAQKSAQNADAARAEAEASHRDSLKATKISSLENKIKNAGRTIEEYENEHKNSIKSYSKNEHGEWRSTATVATGSPPDSIENKIRKDRIGQLEESISAWQAEIQSIKAGQ